MGRWTYDYSAEDHSAGPSQESADSFLIVLFLGFLYGVHWLVELIRPGYGVIAAGLMFVVGVLVWKEHDR